MNAKQIIKAYRAGNPAANLTIVDATVYAGSVVILVAESHEAAFSAVFSN
jgi:hypothetical protein